MAHALQTLLELDSAPVAVAFTDRAPDGVERVSSSAPASCGYWPLAASGRVFYTESADHVSCPVGAHTHGVSLTPEQGRALEGLIGTMVGLQYLDMSEVPKIPHRTSFQVDLVKKACASGGQQAAKNAMKEWVKKAKAAPGGDPDLTCDSCHSDLAPEYPLADGALDKFKKLNALIK